MTTETSNAREWVLVPREITQEMLDAVCSAEGIEPWTDEIMRQTYIAMLDAAPPPAAARGDVRGLVAKWRTLANDAMRRSGTWNGNDIADRIEFMADELEALAAEGVQDGAPLYAAARKLRDSARRMDDGSRWVPGTVFKQFTKALTGERNG